MLGDENISIGIDSSAAESGADTVVRRLDDIKKKSDDTGSSLDRLAGAQRGAFDKMGSAADRQAQIWDRLARGTDEARSRASAMRSEMERLEKQFDPLTAAQKKYYDTLDRIAALEKSHFLSAGRANMFKVAAAKDLKETTDALNGLGGGSHGGNSGFIRELTVLFREMANGNWTRVPGSLSLLAQYSGVFGKIADGMKGANAGALLLRGGIVGLTAAFVGLVAYMGYKANVAAEEMADRLTRVGRAGEITGAQVEKFSRTIAATMNLSTDSVREMATEFVRNGAIASSQLERTTKAAAALALTMNGDTKRATDELGSAMTKIAAGDIKALDNGFAELSFAQKTYISHLIELGRYTEAQTALNQALVDSVSGPRGAKAGFHDLWTEIKSGLADFAQASGLANAFENSMNGLAEGLHNAAQRMGEFIDAYQAWAKDHPKLAGALFGDALIPQGSAGLSDNTPKGSLPNGLVKSLQSGGLGDEIAKGIAAALVAESRGNPNSNWIDPKDGGRVFGYAQLRGDLLKEQLSKYGTSPDSQIRFIIDKMRSDPSRGTALKASSAAEAAFLFLKDFERPGDGLMGDLNRAAGALGVSSKGTFGPMVSYGNSLPIAQRDAINRANLRPDQVQLQQSVTSLTQQYIAQGMKPDDARALAQRVAGIQQSLPRDRAFNGFLNDQQFSTRLAGMNPEQAAVAQAERQAQSLKSPTGRPEDYQLSSAERAKVDAEALAKLDAERNRNMTTYLAQLAQESSYAKMLPEEAEKANAYERARLILNDGIVTGAKQLTEEQKKQIDATLDQQRLDKLVGATRLAERNATIEQTQLIRQQAALQGAAWEDHSQALAVEAKMWPLIAEGMASGLTYAQALAKVEDSNLRKILEQNAAIEHQNQLIQKGVEAANQNSPTFQRMQGLADIAQQRQGAQLAAYTGVFGTGETRDKIVKELTEGFDRATWDITHKFVDQFSDAIGRLAQYFGGKIGGVLDKISQAVSQMAALARGDNKNGGLFGAINDLFGSILGSKFTDSASKAARGFYSGVTGDPKDKAAWSETMSDIRGMFGKNGDITKGIAGLIGIAGQGYQMGTIIGGIGGALFPKKAAAIQTGSQIGGAVGAIAGSFIPGVGPVLGGAIGSALGGIAGAVFGKGKTRKPSGGATFSLGSGGQLTSSYAGDPNGPEDVVNSMASSFISGLQSIVTSLGGTLNSSALARITVGQFDGDFRVNTSGATGPTALNRRTAGTHDFNGDQSGAIQFAIAEAIRNGAVKGISEASQRVLQSAKDPLSVLNAVQAYEQLDISILKLKDPVKGAIADFVDGMKKLNEQFVQAGYTTDELAKMQDYYAEQRKELLKQLEQPYKDFIQTISAGPDSGLSVAGQYQNALTQLGTYEGTLHGGGSVNSDDFLKVANSVFDLGRQMFGSSTDQFAALRQRLLDDSNLAIGGIEAQAPEEKLADEIAKAAADAAVAASTTNGLLTQIRDAITGGAPVPATNGSGGIDNFGGGSGAAGGSSTSLNNSANVTGSMRTALNL